MTGVALPINASSGSPAYDARAFRAAMAAHKMWDGVPLAGRQGLRPMGGSNANIVTLAGSTITVGLHAGVVAPGWATTTGSYDVALTVAETHSLTPADATNPRKDIVIGRVYDHDESPGGLRLYRSEYIAGSANASPAEPAVPQGALRIATIDVPQTGGGSAVVTNNYRFEASAGGVLPVRDTTDRDAIVNPYTGMTVYRMDRGWLEMYDGSAWRSHRMVIAPGNPHHVTHPAAGQTIIYTADGQTYQYSGTVWRTSRPAARLIRTSGGAVPNAVMTVLAMNSEEFDTHGAHDNSVNSSRYVCPISGLYRISGGVGWVPQTSGSPNRRQADLRKNGTTITGSQGPSTHGADTSTCSAQTVTIACNTGDYIELAAFQSSGASLGTATSPELYPFLNVEYVGPVAQF